MTSLPTGAPPQAAGPPPAPPPAPPPGPPRSRTWHWAALAAVLAGLVAGLGLLRPALPLLAAAGAVLVWLAATRPKLLALLALLLVVLATPIDTVLGLGSGADEAAVVFLAVALGVRRFVTEGRLVWLPGGAWFAGYVLLGLTSAVAAGVPAGTSLPAAFVSVKGVVLAWAVAQLRWTREDLVVLVRAGLAAIGAVALTGLLNLLAPYAWAQLTTGRQPLSFIGPVPSVNGLFQHPAAFSRFAGVLAVGALTYGLVVRRSVANTVLVLLTGAFAVLSLQVKSIVGLLATLGATGLRYIRPVGIAGVLALGPLLALVVLPPLVALVTGDIDLYIAQDSARSRLTEGGVTVAAQHFPLGAGFGRYGSATAADDYSPLYYALGFDGRYGLGPESGQFLNDTQWPAIWGEAGWFGAACFAAGLACMLVSLARRTSAGEDRLVRWLRVAGIGWMLLLLIESIAAPVFVSTPSYPFVFAAAGVAASFRSVARERAAAG